MSNGQKKTKKSKGPIHHLHVEISKDSFHKLTMLKLKLEKPFSNIIERLIDVEYLREFPPKR